MNCRADLFWLLERIMPRLHERAGGDKPVHVLGIADPASIPQVLLAGCRMWLRGCCRGVLQAVLCLAIAAACPLLLPSKPGSPDPIVFLITALSFIPDGCGAAGHLRHF